MSYYDEQLINTFNEYYPFERYIIKEPKSINSLFNDLLLVELFIPSTEIKPILNNDGSVLCFTKILNDEVYVKLRDKSNNEIRFGYFDFETHIRENIRDIFIYDIGPYEYELLYTECEDNEQDDLKKQLQIQKNLITQKYGSCNIKDNFIIDDIIKIVNDLE